MAGTQAGGKAAARTNKQKYGKDFYGKIGAKGGKKGRTGGFAAGDEGRYRASMWGSLGGSISRRGVKLTAAQKARKRRDFERTYEHLLRVNKAAEKHRQSVLQSA